MGFVAEKESSSMKIDENGTRFAGSIRIPDVKKAVGIRLAVTDVAAADESVIQRLHARFIPRFEGIGVMSLVKLGEDDFSNDPALQIEKNRLMSQPPNGFSAFRRCNPLPHRDIASVLHQQQQAFPASFLPKSRALPWKTI